MAGIFYICTMNNLISITAVKTNEKVESQIVSLHPDNILQAYEAAGGVAIRYDGDTAYPTIYLVADTLDNVKALILAQAPDDLIEIANTYLGANPNKISRMLIFRQRIISAKVASNGSEIRYDDKRTTATLIKTTTTVQDIKTVIGGGSLTVAINDTFTVADQAARLATGAAKGDVAVQTDTQESYILKQTPATNNANWVQLLFPASVTSVQGLTGAVTIPLASTSQEGVVKIAAYPGGLRDNGLGALETDPNVVPRLVNGQIPAQYLPNSGSGTRHQIRIGRITINHTTGSASGFAGTPAGTLAANNFLFANKRMKLHKIVTHTNILQSNLVGSGPNGFIEIGARYKFPPNVNVSTTTLNVQIQKPDPDFPEIMTPNVKEIYYSLGELSNNLVFHDEDLTPLELPEMEGMYYVNIGLNSGMATKAYFFDVHLEVEYL